MHFCSKCGIEKPDTEFYKDSRTARGLMSACKTCHCAATLAYTRANPQKVATLGKEWRSKNHEWERIYHLKNTYGITLAQYSDLLNLQNGVCAVCQNPCSSGRRLAVDHCHETGHIRGLLCGNCNLAIGKLKDSPHNCFAAAKYLQQTKQISTPRVDLVDSVGYMSPC